MKKHGKVYLVGAGPGDPGLLTLRGKQALERADVVVYDLLANPVLLDLAPASAQRICAGKRAGAHVLTQDQTNALLVKLARQGKTVVRLKGGDPFVFGRGGEEALALAEAGQPFEIVPGISSGLAGPAYAGIPVTHRGLATSCVFVTGQERTGKPLAPKTLKALAHLDATLVFFMATESAARVTGALIRAGRSAKQPAACVMNGTRPDQRVLVSTLGALASEMKAGGFGAPGLLVIGPVAGLRQQLNWFESRPLFGRTYVVTRSREQASVLSSGLCDLGAEVWEVPAIRQVPLKLGHRALSGLAGYHWLVLSSPYGVEVLFQRLFEAGLDARALGPCKVAAVGKSTAEALARHGLRADLVPLDFNAESLAAALLKRVKKGQRVLLARAKTGRDVLPQALAKAGVKASDLALYRTVADAAKARGLIQALEQGKIHGVTFTSSSTVDRFKELFTPAQWRRLSPRIKAYCLGPITRASAEAAGLSIAGVAAKASIPSLLQELAGA